MIQETGIITISDGELCKKAAIRSLGITQIIFGSVSFILGVVALVMSKQKNSEILSSHNVTYDYAYEYELYPATAVGIWSCFWTIVSGGVGVCVGGRSSSDTKIVTHMLASILAILSEISGCLTAGLVAGTVKDYHDYPEQFFVIHITLFILGTASIVMLATSSMIACRIIPCCCKELGDPVPDFYVIQSSVGSLEMQLDESEATEPIESSEV